MVSDMNIKCWKREVSVHSKYLTCWWYIFQKLSTSEHDEVVDKEEFEFIKFFLRYLGEASELNRTSEDFFLIKQIVLMNWLSE